MLILALLLRAFNRRSPHPGAAQRSFPRGREQQPLQGTERHEANILVEQTYSLLGVLVYSDSDLSTAYNLAKQIRLMPLSSGLPGL